jgi:hypothetical protein
MMSAVGWLEELPERYPLAARKKGMADEYVC